MATSKPAILVGKENKEESHESSNFADPDPSDPYPMFLGLLDPDPDPLVRCTDPDPYIIKQN